MNTKQKFSYMVFGAVIGIAGLAIGLCVSPLTAKRDTFDEIVCNRLVISVPDNRSVVLEHAGKLASRSDTASLQITDAVHKSGSIVFECNEYGTSLRVLSKDGTGKIRLRQFEQSAGSIAVFSARGRGLVELTSEAGGLAGKVSLWEITNDDARIVMRGAGSIQIGGARWHNPESESLLTDSMILMDATSGSDSSVSVLGANYNRGVKLSSSGIGVTVCGDDKSPLVTMQNDEHGGRVDIYGKTDNVARVSLGINEYGHGAVSTWDKNGYRLK